MVSNSQAVLGLALLLLLQSALVLDAQQDLGAGDRVRVRLADRDSWIVGRFETVTDSTITLRLGLNLHRYELEGLTRAQVWRSTNPFPIIATTTAVGLGAGLIYTKQRADRPNNASHTAVVSAFALGGLLLGTAIYFIAGRGGWEDILQSR